MPAHQGGREIQMTALAMRSVDYGQCLELQNLMDLSSTYDDSKEPMTRLCKIRRMKLGNPRTGLRPEPKRIATTFHLRNSHRLNQGFTPTMEFALSEAGTLIALVIVRTSRRRSNSGGTAMKAPG
jgi:hypothetical protein